MLTIAHFSLKFWFMKFRSDINIDSKTTTSYSLIVLNCSSCQTVLGVLRISSLIDTAWLLRNALLSAYTSKMSLCTTSLEIRLDFWNVPLYGCFEMENWPFNTFQAAWTLCVNPPSIFWIAWTPVNQSMNLLHQGLSSLSKVKTILVLRITRKMQCDKTAAGGDLSFFFF